METIAIAIAIGVPVATLILAGVTFVMTRRNGAKVTRLELDRDVIIRQLRADLETCIRDRIRYADMLAREISRNDD